MLKRKEHEGNDAPPLGKTCTGLVVLCASLIQSIMAHHPVLLQQQGMQDALDEAGVSKLSSRCKHRSDFSFWALVPSDLHRVFTLLF